MASLGATVVAMDLSDAVRAARENLNRYDSLVLQGDIMCPPLAANTFDLVYSEGVLHHTSRPKEAFRRLVELVKPGGYIAAGFYGRREKGPTPFLLLRQPLRAILSRLPARVVWIITGISPLLNAIPFLNYVMRKTVILYDPKNPSWKSTWCLNYDFYGPHAYQHYLRPSEINQLWRDTELDLLEVVETTPGFHRSRKSSSRHANVG
jgi:2-polyprenyl-3-methyl-5-hydroxy-6-metoxy-1,4-benzoquinol methylase